jgi:hypothetical protein
MKQRNESFSWDPLGEQWWRDAARDLRLKASEKQIMFACAKHRGCSNTEAARQSGYGGDEETIRQAAYKAVRTTVVKELLAFAVSEERGPTAGVVEASEAKEILSKLARSADPNTSIRAIEQLSKLKEREAESASGLEGDGFFEWRFAREYLQMPGGAPALIHLWTANGKCLSHLPLLHDVHKAVMRDDPDLWERKAKQFQAPERAWLQRHLDDPEWQREARIKIWKEIGIDIESVANGSLSLSPEYQQAVAIRSNGDIVGHDYSGDSAQEEEAAGVAQ